MKAKSSTWGVKNVRPEDVVETPSHNPADPLGTGFVSGDWVTTEHVRHESAIPPKMTLGLTEDYQVQITLEIEQQTTIVWFPTAEQIDMLMRTIPDLEKTAADARREGRVEG